MRQIKSSDSSKPGGNDTSSVREPLRPFLKWAGGKRWLTKHVYQFPAFDGRYIEPFVGGGSVFLTLRPKKSVLGDINGSLINCYSAIRDNSDLVERYLKEYAKGHASGGASFYYRVRSSQPRSDCKKAAQFLYLNRTCWNGLYRVNRLGQFNVPRGTKDQVVFPDEDFGVLADALSKVELYCQDFERTMELARENDLIFADPPYTVLHNSNGFLKYNENMFSWDDQVRLKNASLRAAQKGAFVFVTNADHHSIRELYKGIAQIESLPRQSKISGSVKGRKQTTELLLRIEP